MDTVKIKAPLRQERPPQKQLQKKWHNQIVAGRYGKVLYNRFDQYIGRSMALYGEYSEAEVNLYYGFLWGESR